MQGKPLLLPNNTVDKITRQRIPQFYSIIETMPFREFPEVWKTRYSCCHGLGRGKTNYMGRIMTAPDYGLNINVLDI